MSDCGCFHPLYLDIDSVRQGQPACNLADDSTSACISDIMNQFISDARSCPCDQACYETKYNAITSSTSWPARQYLPNAMINYGFATNGVNNQEEMEQMTHNLMQLNIYFDSLSEELISSDILYTPTTLLSGIGGALSLYLGISIAMVFEIVEIFLDSIGNFFNWTNGKPLGRKNVAF